MLSRITFVVLPTLPFRLDLTVWTARRRSGNAIDRWDGHVYRRVLVLHGTPVEIAVEQAGSRLHVCATGAGSASTMVVSSPRSAARNAAA